MDRAEKVGLGIAVAGHVALFGALSLGFLDTPNPAILKPKPIEVSLVPEVALEAAAPQASEAPSTSVAPETGEPADSPPPAPAPAPAPVPVPVPKPAPRAEPKPVPKPEPKPVSKPEPKPVPKPAPKPEPKPQPRPAPKPIDKPKPVEKPKPAAKPQPAPKAAPKPAPKVAAAPAKTTARSPSSSAGTAASASKGTAAKPATKPAAKPGTGANQTATAAKPRGGRLGNDFLKGLTAEPSKAPPSDAPPAAAKIDGKALAAIVQAIARQIQPCADRQVDPGPGANQIVTTLNLRLNRDGTLAATPTVVRQTGIDDENERYARRVVDLGVAAFKGCSPLHLPAEYYATANGGWSNINYNWKLR